MNDHLCGAEGSAQTREYAPLLVMGGGVRAIVHGRACGRGLRGGGGLRAIVRAGSEMFGGLVEKPGVGADRGWWIGGAGVSGGVRVAPGRSDGVAELSCVMVAVEEDVVHRGSHLRG